MNNPSRLWLLALVALAVLIVGLVLSNSAPDAEPNTHQVSDWITLAGVIDQSSDAQLAKTNTLVVDLRLAREGIEADQSRFAEIGVDYLHLPMGRELPSADQVAAFDRILTDNPDRPILLRCGSGNRAGLLWAAHSIENGLDAEEAIRRVSGIANLEFTQQSIRAYAERAAAN